MTCCYEKNKHYKDQGQIKNQCKNLSDTLIKERKFLKELAKMCKEAHKREEINKKIFLDYLVDPDSSNGKELTPDHKCCNGFDDTPRSGGEKQICHCMFYYNNDKPKKCKTCKSIRWKNVGDIRVEEFEYPTKYDIDGVGGIDLILKDKDIIYGAEVKLHGSNETVSRMVAEILTYYAVDNTIKYEPAIAVFRNSNQDKVITALEKEKNRDWFEIKSLVRVFVIDYQKNGTLAQFVISPYSL